MKGVVQHCNVQGSEQGEQGVQGVKGLQHSNVQGGV